MKAQDNFGGKNNINFVAVTLLLLLPGCDWFTRKETKPVAKEQAVERMPLTGGVLVSWQQNKAEGVPLVTTDSLRMEKDKLLKTNPQLKAMISLMDEKQLDRNLSEGLMNQAIVDRYIQERGMDENPDYKAELEEGYKAIERMINTKFFTQAFPVQIADAEIRDFYEKNKEAVPNLLISRGGIEATGVVFDNEKMANEFMRGVKEERDLQKAAQKAGLADKIKDFKLVHAQSIGIEAPLREKIVNMKKIPATELFKIDDKTFWIVRASKKEESKYRPLEQVKGDIRQFLEKGKRTEKFDEEMNRLKDEYKVVVNEDYFKSDQEPTEVTAEQQKESKNVLQQPAQQKVADNKAQANKEVAQGKQSVNSGPQAA